MAYCTNPACRHRQRTGKPAEYRPGTHRCADCDHELTPGEAPAPAPPSSQGWPPDLIHRGALTAAAMVVALALNLLPHPLLDLQGAGSLGVHAPDLGPFCLGVRPLLVGWVLVELGALILPGTRARRRQDPELRRRLWLAGALLGVALAWAQGWALATALESMGSWSGHGEPLVRSPGWFFRLSTASMTAGGVALMAVLARWLDRRGLGPGIAALLLADGVMVVGRGLLLQARAVVLGQSTVFWALLALLAVVGLTVAAWRVLGHTPRFARGMPACLPTTGQLPYELALIVLVVPGWLASLGLGGGETWARQFWPGGGLWLGVGACLVLVGSPLASTLFYWRRRRWWSDAHRGPWILLVAASTALLLVLVLAEGLAMRSAPNVPPAGVFGWIALVALVGDACTEIGSWRKAGRAPSVLAVHQDMADALAQLRDLEAGDPDGHYVLTGRRFRALTYFFGPYIPLRILGTPSPHTGGVTS